MSFCIKLFQPVFHYWIIDIGICMELIKRKNDSSFFENASEHLQVLIYHNFHLSCMLIESKGLWE